MPVWADTLKHSVYKYDFEELESVVSKKMRVIDWLKEVLVKYVIIEQIVEFWIEMDGVKVGKEFEQMRKREHAKVCDAVEEFRIKAAQL